MRELVIATRNEKKLKELRRYLKGVKASIISLNEHHTKVRFREDKTTFKGNAANKALAVSRATGGGLALADDSGLSVDALGGRPGVKSARFAGPGKRDRDNNLKLLKTLEDVPAKRRDAHFVCAVAIADAGRIVKLIEKRCNGRIADRVRGHRGFGYDPLFLIPKHKRTFGEMGLKVKDRMSHRSKALAKARQFLKSYL